MLKEILQNPSLLPAAILPGHHQMTQVSNLKEDVSFDYQRRGCSISVSRDTSEEVHLPAHLWSILWMAEMMTSLAEKELSLWPMVE